MGERRLLSGLEGRKSMGTVLKFEGTPLLEHPLFEDAERKLREFRATLISCETQLSEDAKIIRRQIDFILEALNHFQNCLREHSIQDLR